MKRYCLALCLLVVSMGACAQFNDFLMSIGFQRPVDNSHRGVEAPPILPAVPVGQLTTYQNPAPELPVSSQPASQAQVLMPASAPQVQVSMPVSAPAAPSLQPVQ